MSPAVGNQALLFDVGNTRLKWGVVRDGRMFRTGSIDHEAIRNTGFSSIATRLPRRVGQVIASNVAGATFATRLSSFIGIHCDAGIRYVHAQKQAYGLTNSYSRPRRMGVDRWSAMIGARAEYKSALCVIDAGTAVTLDAVDRQGVHLGGQIVPGLSLMMNALASATSDIGSGARMPPDTGNSMERFAKSTRAAVGCGALGAVCGVVERAVRTMRSAGFRPKVILTGGDASRILKELEGPVIHRPHLVLQGLEVMLQQES